MKAIKFSKILSQSRILCPALTASAMVFSMTLAQAGSPSAPAAPGETPAANWIGFTIGGAFVNGDDAAMMQRTRTNGDFYGGIDSMQFTKALDKSTTLTLDGHALPGLEDYEGNLTLTKADIGYIKAGYKQFRTYYDGSGGFMPQLGSQYTEPAGGDELHLDRGEFNFEAGLRMEKLPEITFKYKHAFREGQKDSTSWGERPKTTGTSTTAFKFLPSLWNIDETVDTFDLNVEHTVGNTDLGIGLNYEHVDYSNTLSFDRGAVKTTAGTPPTVANSLVDVTRKDAYTLDMFSGNIHSVTRFNDKLWLSGGFAYTTLNSDSDGSGSIVRTPGGIPASTGAESSFNTQNGAGDYQQCVGNLNLMWNPIADLTITPSVRLEHSSQDTVTAINKYAPSYAAFPLNPVTTLAGLAYTADTDTTSTTAELDLRYTGISDVVLYAKGVCGFEEQAKIYHDIYTPWNASQPAVALGYVPTDWLREDIDTNYQEYTAGANWYPVSGLSVSLQGLYSERDASYTPRGLNGPGGAFTLEPNMIDHDTTVDDVNLRITWRPMSNLSLVTRYDFRETEYSNRGVRWAPTAIAGGPPAPTVGPPMTGILPEVQSSNVTAHIVSECATWNPLARLYVQGNISYTWAQTDTNTLWVPDSNNEYVSAGLTVGYAIDDRTDITANYTYYGASNYSQQGAPYTSVSPADIAYAMGYGLNTQEHAVNVTLTRALSANMVWNLRYGFVTSQTHPSPDQTGGFNDFNAQMISTGLQIRF